jgi:hypothetical protein
MKAITRDAYGAAGVLQLRDIAKPVIGALDVLLDVRAAGIDPGVWIFMTGRPLSVRPRRADSTAGVRRRRRGHRPHLSAGADRRRDQLSGRGHPTGKIVVACARG